MVGDFVCITLLLRWRHAVGFWVSAYVTMFSSGNPSLGLKTASEVVYMQINTARI